MKNVSKFNVFLVFFLVVVVVVTRNLTNAIGMILIKL